MPEAPRKPATGPFSPPPAPPPDLHGRVRGGLALVAVGLAAAGVAWLLAGPGLPGQGASRLAPYTLGHIKGAETDAELAFYRKRVAEDPGRFLEQNLLASACLRKARETGEEGWYGQAEAAARASLRAMPTGNPEAELVKAQIAVAYHRFPEARRIAEAVARRRADAGVGALLATIALAQGRPAEAERLLAIVNGAGPSTA
jgi:hypothetical protein